ncbi:MAG: exonuclease domain-containing protein [Myxococcota bacterium]|nr:exonuclease domain-containing protein [Myxococcota bacterium]
MIFLSLDIETSGLTPGLYSVVSIGAVPVVRRRGAWSVNLKRTFYAEIQPQPGLLTSEDSVEIHGLDDRYLRDNGASPVEAMTALRTYLETLKSRYGRVRPAAWPSSFDSPFISWMSEKYLGENILGHSTIDIPSFAMGALGCTDRRRLHHVMKEAGYQKPENLHKHNALSDAIEQAETLCWLLNFSGNEASP